MILQGISGIEMPLLMGIAASVLHVWTGPDHLAAVTPLVFDTKKDHWKIGTFWGIGHLMGMLLIGILFYLFKEYIPIEHISIYSEQIVGFILIGLGIWSFYRMKYDHQRHHHTHPHVHSDEIHDFVHVHQHQHENHTHIHPHVEKESQNGWAAISVGIIHGFAGISHFVLMFPALAFNSKWETGQYLVGFGIGTISAMLIFSIIIGKFHTLNPNQHSHHVFKNLRFWGGLVAVVVGIFWLFKNVLS